MTLSEDHLGIMVLMPAFSFQAEIAREQIPSLTEAVDQQLFEDGGVENDEERLAAAIATAIDLTSDENEYSADEAVNHLSTTFLYAFVKLYGVEKLLSLKGMIAMLAGNELTFSACDTREEFDVLAAQVHATASQVGKPGGATLH